MADDVRVLGEREEVEDRDGDGGEGGGEVASSSRYHFCIAGLPWNSESLISNLVFSLVCTCVFLFFFNSVSLVSIDVVKTGPATKPK